MKKKRDNYSNQNRKTKKHDFSFQMLQILFFVADALLYSNLFVGNFAEHPENHSIQFPCRTCSICSAAVECEIAIVEVVGSNPGESFIFLTVFFSSLYVSGRSGL